MSDRSFKRVADVAGLLQAHCTRCDQSLSVTLLRLVSEPSSDGASVHTVHCAACITLEVWERLAEQSLAKPASPSLACERCERCKRRSRPTHSVHGFQLCHECSGHDRR